MSEREHMSQERMEAVRNNLDSFKFCASWFHNLLDEAQRLAREAASLRQQRDALREALQELVQAIDDDEGEIGPCTAELASRTQTARAALSQCERGDGEPQEPTP